MTKEVCCCRCFLAAVSHIHHLPCGNGVAVVVVVLRFKQGDIRSSVQRCGGRGGEGRGRCWQHSWDNEKVVAVCSVMDDGVQLSNGVLGMLPLACHARQKRRPVPDAHEQHANDCSSNARQLPWVRIFTESGHAENDGNEDVKAAEWRDNRSLLRHCARQDIEHNVANATAHAAAKQNVVGGCDACAGASAVAQDERDDGGAEGRGEDGEEVAQGKVTCGPQSKHLRADGGQAPHGDAGKEEQQRLALELKRPAGAHGEAHGGEHRQQHPSAARNVHAIAKPKHAVNKWEKNIEGSERGEHRGLPASRCHGQVQGGARDKQRAREEANNRHALGHALVVAQRDNGVQLAGGVWELHGNGTRNDKEHARGVVHAAVLVDNVLHAKQRLGRANQHHVRQ